MDIEPGTSSEADKSGYSIGRWLDKEFEVYSWILVQEIGRTFGTGCKKKPLMANLLRHLNTRRVDINYSKLVIQGSLW